MLVDNVEGNSIIYSKTLRTWYQYRSRAKRIESVAAKTVSIDIKIGRENAAMEV